MSNTIFIYSINGNIYQKIEYINTDDLNKKLKALIINNDSDSDLYIT